MKSGVKVVPVSICNLYKWMPSSAASPLAFPKQVEVRRRIHVCHMTLEPHT